MATATVPPNTPTEQPETARSDADPHPEWKRRRLEVRDRLNMGESDDPDLCAEAVRLEDLIADTPARTFAGVATQIWLATDGIEECLGANVDGHEHRALRNALAALERLATAEARLEGRATP